MVCPACEAWMNPIYDEATRTVGCPECGNREPHHFLPLFIITGPSGVGKTTIIPELQRLLPEWEAFETDILWDSAGDWNMVKCNWLRIADYISRREPPRPTILCGTMQTKEIEGCDSFPSFGMVHWLALLCEPEELARRLRARPAWRGCTEEFIADQLNYARWFREHAHSDFDPSLTILDTTNVPISQTVREIRDWALTRWNPDDSFTNGHK